MLNKLIKLLLKNRYYRAYDKFCMRYIWGVRPVSTKARWRNTKTGRFAKFDIPNLLIK